MNEKNNSIYTKVRDYIFEKKLVAKGDRLLLAVSAGKDSIMLLDIFLHLKEDLSIDIALFHLNHMMRGGESDDDESFIADTAGKHRLELFLKKYDFRNNIPSGSSFEDYARIKRYEFLNQICRENNFQKIATAHNRDDNIETILMRIFSGTGVHGLHGIDHKRDNIIRPMLSISSGEIYNHLKINNIKWREDMSNKDNKYLRNFVRNSLLPLANERFKDADESILSLSGIAREYTAIIDELLIEKGISYTLNKDGVIIEKERSNINNKKIFKYIIADIIRNNLGKYVTAGMLEEIYKKAVSERSNMILYQKEGIIIKKGIQQNKKVIVISGNHDNNNRISAWEYKIDLLSKKEKSIFLKEINKTIFYKYVDYNFFLGNKDRHDVIFISIHGDANHVHIRNRRNGDRIKLTHGVKKIKDLMIDYKLDNIQKNLVPLLIINREVAAIMTAFVADRPGRVSIDYYVNSGSKKILAIHSDKYQV